MVSDPHQILSMKMGGYLMVWVVQYPDIAEIEPTVDMEGVEGAPSSHVPVDIAPGFARNARFAEFVRREDQQRSTQRFRSSDMSPDLVIAAERAGRKGKGEGKDGGKKGRSRSAPRPAWDDGDTLYATVGEPAGAAARSRSRGPHAPKARPPAAGPPHVGMPPPAHVPDRRLPERS